MFRYLFWVILTCYCCLLLLYPSFSIIDDHLFLSTTLNGKWLPWLISPSTGRFFPLTAQEFNLVSLFSSKAWAYYFFNLVELILFSALFLSLLKKLGVRSSWRYGLASFLLLTPECTASFFRFFVGEKHLLLWGALYIMAYAKWLKTYRAVYGFFIIILTNLLLYQKETALFYIGSMAVVPLFLQFLNKDKEIKKNVILHIFITLSLIIYLGIFYWVAYRHATYLYGQSELSRLLIMAKNFINYLQNSPLLLTLLPLLFLRRVWDITIKKEKAHILVDSLLITAMMSLCGFFIVNLYSDRYLLVTYLFFLIPLGFFLSRYRYHYLLIFLLLFHPFGYTLHTLSHFKYFPYHFQTGIEKVVTLIKESKKDTLRITLLGIDPNPSQQGELFDSVKSYLIFHGIPQSKFQLVSEKEETADIAILLEPLITGYSFDAEHQQKVLTKYNLEWKSESPFAIPDLSYKALFKYLILKKDHNKNIIGRGLIQSGNIFKWPNVWIYTNRN